MQKGKNSRNPLKSGQCFLHSHAPEEVSEEEAKVAIPSNRVNVSYPWYGVFRIYSNLPGSGRNPLKSGQCFLLSL